MLCSVSAGKSGSNWLDRLRSNKGFPTGEEDLDLDHFLTQNPSPSPSDSPPHSNRSSIPQNAQGVIVNRSEISRRTGVQDKEWFGIMSDVLSELFYMGGGGSKLSWKKIPRKQTKPRLCVVSARNNNNSSNSNTSVIEEKKKKKKKKKKSSGFVRNGENAPAAAATATATASLDSDSNSLVEKKAGNVVDVDVDVDGDEENDEDEEEEEEEEKEEEKGERGLKGYSRSEVTVIDTSCGGLWKSEKLVFRRKNVWKVREKKGKLWSFGRKKRKGNDNAVVGGGGGKKKAKFLASEEENNGGGDQCVTPSSNEVSS